MTGLNTPLLAALPDRTLTDAIVWVRSHMEEEQVAQIDQGRIRNALEVEADLETQQSGS